MTINRIIGSPKAFNVKRHFLLIMIFLILTNLSILLDLSFLRQITGFLFLTLLPGLLILQILKLDKLESSETVVLSVGLSVFTLMFVGLSINFLYPIIGISRPISIFPLITLINITVILLYIIGYKRNVAIFPFSIHNCGNSIRRIFSPPLLLTLLIPLLSLLGALVTRYYESSIFSMLLIAVIALVVILVGFDKLIPERLYPLAVFMIGAALILNRTLTSPYLFGSDIHYEYYYHKMVEFNSYWNPSAFTSNCNGMLSTVMLPTIYSILLKMDGILVYKTIFPLIFSLVPVALYQVFRKQIGNRCAFLSAFFFMSFYPFFTTMSYLPRQQIAEFFLGLIVLIIVHREITPPNKSILLVIFITALIVSHYATTYIFLFYLFLTFLSLHFRSWVKTTENHHGNRMHVIHFDSKGQLRHLLALFSRSRTRPHFIDTRNATITVTLVTLSIVMALSWYIHVSRSGAFDTIIHIGDHVFTSIITEMFSSSAIDPNIARAFGVGISKLPLLQMIGHYWQIITEILIAIGIVYVILGRGRIKLNREYLLFSLISMVLIIMCIALPYFASSMNMDRIYHLTLFFLSPFCIIGVEAILSMTSRLSKIAFLKHHQMRHLVLMIILIPYFLFNTGFVTELVLRPENFQLGINHMENRDLNKGSYFNWSSFIASPIPEQDVVSCRWMSNRTGSNPIYADGYRLGEVVGYGLILDARDLILPIPENKYIFLGYQNVKERFIQCWDLKNVGTSIKFDIAEISPPLAERNKIYTNEGSEIYR